MNDQSLAKSLAEAIRTHRASIGLSQEELADRSGLHRTYISDIERGCRNIALTNAQKIAFALGIKLSELISRAEADR